MRTIQPAAPDYYEKLIEGVQRIPGVESAGLLSWVPLDNESQVARRFFRVAGVSRPAREQWAWYSAVSPEAFRALRISLRAGRLLSERDTEDAPWTAVVNESFVRHFFGNENPIGKTLTLSTVEEEKPREIVGVVGDVILRSRFAETPEIFVNFHQQPMIYPGVATGGRLHMAMAVRSEAGAAVIPQIRALAADLDRTHPVFGIKTMNEVIYNSTDIARFYTGQLVGFAAMALLLASVGIYGVMSYAVGRRRHEIGVRMALGASHAIVLRDVLGRGLKLALIGLAIGLAGSFALTRFIASYLFGVKPIDAVTFAVASVVLVLVALGAVYRPARRATEVDPMVVLRCE
jgi:predicted permease